MRRKRILVVFGAFVSAMALASSALAAPGDITLASTSDAGVKGNGNSVVPSFSANGSKVAFASSATNLDPADTETGFDVYVKDLASGDITLASTSEARVNGNGDSLEPTLSADGTKVAFSSNATNLDPADTNGLPDIYVKDLVSGDITVASTSDSGVKGNFSSTSPSLSADGTKIAFDSRATNLDPADTDLLIDVYVKDVLTGDITVASTSDAGVKGNSTSARPSLSADGTKVAFDSSATNLDPGDTEGGFDVYVKDLASGDITLASTSDAGVKGSGQSLRSSLSADGTKVAFRSAANTLDPADRDVHMDVYVKDLASGDITLASTSDAGLKADSPSLDPSLSADGTKVAFPSSASNLDPGDTGPDADIYVKDLVSGDIALASTSDAGVKGNLSSFEPSLSADGAKVAFGSGATNLDPGDPDTIEDIYVKQLGAAPSTQCSDGIDNDGDGPIDFPNDPGCASTSDDSESPDIPPSTQCSDGIDNDGDDLIDFPNDPGCFSVSDDAESPDPPPPPPQCSDGNDNDGDGLVDFPNDSGCVSASDNSERIKGLTQCSDGVDNDGDGRVDFPNDPDCTSAGDTAEAPAACSDGVDNDGDGLFDFPNDPGCVSASDNEERNKSLTQCSDGVDNDGDGRVDFPYDSDCTSAGDTTEAPAACSDGVDNDGDGLFDFPNDPGCVSGNDNDERNKGGGSAERSLTLGAPFALTSLPRPDRVPARVTGCRARLSREP